MESLVQNIHSRRQQDQGEHSWWRTPGRIPPNSPRMENASPIIIQMEPVPDSSCESLKCCKLVWLLDRPVRAVHKMNTTVPGLKMKQHYHWSLRAACQRRWKNLILWSKDRALIRGILIKLVQNSYLVDWEWTCNNSALVYKAGRRRSIKSCPRLYNHHPSVL